MNINQLNELLKIDSSSLTLAAETLPVAQVSAWLVQFNNGAPIVISSANKTVSEQQIVVTGTCDFLNVQQLETTAYFAVDSDENPTVVIYFQLMDQAHPTPWDFGHSLTQLPPFFPSGNYRQLLQSLKFTSPALILATHAGLQDPSQQEPSVLAAGLNFQGQLQPQGMLGLFAEGVAPDTTVNLRGTISLPTDATKAPPLTNEQWPWQVPQAQGVMLEADLGLKLQWGAMTLSQTKLCIYSPPTTVWQQQNPTYLPSLALTGVLDIPSANLMLQITALIDPQVRAAEIVANLEGATINALDALVDLTHGGGLVDTLPDAVKRELDKATSLELVRVAVALSSQEGAPSVDFVSALVSLPAAQWELWHELTVSGINLQLIVSDPFGSARNAYVLTAGELSFAGATLDIVSQIPGFLTRASLSAPVTIPLSSLFKDHFPTLPQPPDMNIDSLVLNVTPGAGYQLNCTMADEPGWTIPVGPVPLTFSAVSLQLSKDASGSSGSFSGTVLLGSDFELDATYNTPGEFTIYAQLPEIHLLKLLQKITQSDLKLPDGFDLTLSSNAVLIERDNGGEYTFSLSTNVDGFGLLAFTAMLQDNWGFALGMEVPGSSLGKLPGVGPTLSKINDYVGLDELLLVVSSLDNAGFQFPSSAEFDTPALGSGNITLPSQANGLVRGFNLYAKLSMVKNKGLQALAHWLQLPLNGSLGVTLAVSLPNPDSNSRCFVSVSDNIQNGITLAGEVGVLIQGTDVGAFLTAEVNAKIQGQPVRFDVTALVVEDGIFVSGTMQGSIQFKPVTLSNLALMIGIDFEGIPSLGVACTLDVSDFDSSMALFFDSADPVKSMVAGAVSNLTVGNVANSLSGGAVIPSELTPVLDQIGLKGLHAFDMPDTLVNALDNRDLPTVASAFHQYGGMNIPGNSSQLLLVVATAGHSWRLTDMRSMQHYLLSRQGNKVSVSLEAQFYLAPQLTQIGNITFPQAIYVDASIDYLVLKEEIRVEVAPSEGILVDVSCSPIVVLNGTFFSLTGSHGDKGPRFSLCTYERTAESDKRLRPPHILISGDLKLMGADISQVYLMISTRGVEVDIKEQLSPLLHIDVSGVVASLSDMSLSGSATVGVNQHLNLPGPLGSMNVTVDVGGKFSMGFDGRNASAGFSGRLDFLTIHTDLPRIALDVNGPSLAKLPDSVWALVRKEILDNLNPSVWAAWMGMSVISGVTEIGKVFNDYFHIPGDEAARLIQDNITKDAAQIGRYLVGGGYPNSVIAGALRSIGMPAAEALQFFRGIVPDKSLEGLLETAGYPTSEVTQLIQKLCGCIVNVPVCSCISNFCGCVTKHICHLCGCVVKIHCIHDPKGVRDEVMNSKDTHNHE